MNNKIIKSDLTNILKAIKSLSFLKHDKKLAFGRSVKIERDTATITNLDISIRVKLLEGSIDTAFLMTFADVDRMEKLCSKGGYITAELNSESKLVFKDFKTGIETVGFETIPVSEYPEIKQFYTQEKQLILCLKNIEPLLTARNYISFDDSRRVVHGININSESIVATNGKFLYCYNHNQPVPAGYSKTINVDDKYLKLLTKEYDIKIYSFIDKAFEDYTMIESSNYNIVIKNIIGDYPNYKQVIPEKFNESTGKIDTEKILNNLKIQDKYKVCSCYDINSMNYLSQVPDNESTIVYFCNEFIETILKDGFDTVLYNNNHSPLKFIKGDNKEQFIIIMPYRS